MSPETWGGVDIADLYSQLLRAYLRYEDAAMDGAEWAMGADVFAGMRAHLARLHLAYGVDDLGDVQAGQRVPGVKLLALPVLISADPAEAPRLVPGPNARP